MISFLRPVACTAARNLAFSQELISVRSISGSLRARSSVRGWSALGGVARAYRRFEHGPGVVKVDLAIEGPVPWSNPDCGRAGTVHLGGTSGEIATTERDIAAGRMPDRPFVLVGQQFIADPTRSVGNLDSLWAYAHVPTGTRVTPPRRSSTRSSGSPPACASGSSPGPCARPRRWRRTTRTTSAATSSAARTRCASS